MIRPCRMPYAPLLTLHPDSRCFAATHVEVGVERPRADSLVLSYIVTGKMSEVRIPPAIAAARSDELWRHTCFEAFWVLRLARRITNSTLRLRHNGRHIEFNGYQNGMLWRARSAHLPTEVCDGLQLLHVARAAQSWIALSGLSHKASWRLRFWAALIKNQERPQVIRALAHPPGSRTSVYGLIFRIEFCPSRATVETAHRSTRRPTYLAASLTGSACVAQRVITDFRHENLSTRLNALAVMQGNI